MFAGIYFCEFTDFSAIFFHFDTNFDRISQKIYFASIYFRKINEIRENPRQFRPAKIYTIKVAKPWAQSMM